MITKSWDETKHQAPPVRKECKDNEETKPKDAVNSAKKKKRKKSHSRSNEHNST